MIKDLWKLACEFSVVIYESIRASCIKLICNHAKKSSLEEENGVKSSFGHLAFVSPNPSKLGDRACTTYVPIFWPDQMKLHK